jgi:hypothetical protein
MSDDDRPVDPTIRPVLPSRVPAPERALPQAPMYMPREMLTEPNVPMPPQPENPRVKNSSKKVTEPKDARRSAAAKEAWKKRRKNAKRPMALVTPHSGKSQVHGDSCNELGVLMRITALLEPLPAAKRKAILTVLQGLVS